VTEAPRPLFAAPAASAGAVLAAAHDTGGALGLVETVIPSGHSTPLHVHAREDEAFYVLSGTVDFVCGEERFRAEAGAFVYLPSTVPHTFLSVGPEDARVLVLLLPGGLERAFAEPERFGELLEEGGVETVGPPLEPG
jgi:mannose-6-phosphate isomerase-like protein (cupin superfamily)